MSRKSKISRMPADRTECHHRGVLFLQGVPLTTKSAFKSACAQRNETMRDAIIKFMRDYVDDARKEIAAAWEGAKNARERAAAATKG